MNIYLKVFKLIHVLQSSIIYIVTVHILDIIFLLYFLL